MSFRVVISSTVCEELILAQDLLEEMRSGYGDKFAESFAEAIKIISNYALLNRLRYRKSRELQISKFSHLLVYQVYDDAVFVQRLVHVKRSQRKKFGR